MIDTCYIGDVRDATEAEIAYCAGVIDSDGTIGVKRSTYAMRHNNGGQATFSERICVKQVTPEAIDLLHAKFGGCRYYGAPGAKRGRRLYVWQITDLKAVACLRVLLPYLRIKRLQAENCIALRVTKDASKKARVAFGRGHVGATARSPENSLAMEYAYHRAKELNRVGV